MPLGFSLARFPQEAPEPAHRHAIESGSMTIDIGSIFMKHHLRRRNAPSR